METYNFNFPRKEERNMEDNTQKKFLIINLILIFIAMVLELFAAGSSTNFGLAASLVLIFALASAAVYYFYGCKKNAATYYRITVYVFAIPYLVMIAASATSGHAAMAVLAAIAFGAICVLAEAKDYGYIKSLILGLLVLIISIVLLVYGFVAGFETSEGQPVDVLLYWAYVMLGIAVASVVVVGLAIGITNNPKSLVRLGIGLAALAVLVLASFLLAKGAPAMGMLNQPEASTLKLTDTLLNLTYICGAGAVVSIIAGEVRLLISNKK